MATAVYHMLPRHFKPITRNEHFDVEEKIRMEKIKEAFSKLKWDQDVFDAEYLVKKSKDDFEYEGVLCSISSLIINNPAMIDLLGKDWILLNESILRKNVANRMREYWISTQEEHNECKKLKKRK